MKISLICICVFLFCTVYWAFGLSHILTSAENAVPSASTSASVLLSNNFTDSSSSDSEGYQTVLKSEGDLDTNLDLTKKLDQVPKNEELHQEYAFIDGVSQNSGVAHEVIGSSPGVIHTLVDSRTLQEKAEHSGTADYSSHHNKTPQLEALKNEKAQDIVNSENKTIEKNLTVEIKLETGEEGVNISDNTHQTEELGTEVPTTQPKINATSEKDESPEDIPSFSEWTQKQLEEAEKKKEEANSSTQNQQNNGKPASSNRKRWKNYASPDCGAKIIAANPESNSAGSVLTASRDEYKLNACTNRIWFIVELCEAIQAKRIELANFELFSSSPKDFSISVSDRFPTRDWSSVGQFTAKDERDIQNFDLYPHLFGKYIKFEMHSHHGSEHYCPISLFRVFGTSEFEVLETENEVNANTNEDDDDDDDDPINTMDNGDVPKNLFSSATDAVISIVKKAAEVLGNKGNASSSKYQENITAVKYTPLISTCTTPSHIVVCNNCSDTLFGQVFELLSCDAKSLTQLVVVPKIKQVLYKTDVCSPFGLEFCNGLDCSIPNAHKSYITALFSPKLIAALCNIVAINECKVVRNISTNATTVASPRTNDSEVFDSKIIKLGFTEENTVANTISTSTDVDKTVAQDKTLTETEYTSQIKPTRTLTSDVDVFPIDATKNVEFSTTDQEVHPTESLLTQTVQNDSVVVSENKTVTHQMEHIEVSSEVVSDIETSTESGEHLEDHLDSLVSDEESSNVASSTLSPPVLPQGQKESVFLRLSNRIKALERNMSLSSQYLEELSRRYKKQVEEMQRLLDKTINTLNEENKKKEERTQHLEEQILMLRESINLLIEDKKAWMNTTYWLFLSGVVLVGILLFCRRNQEFNQSNNETRSNGNQIWRRMSVDAITNKTPVKKRRPSEEALLISGTYTDLMIDELDSSQRLKNRKRRKKKLQKSNSITTLNEEIADSDNVQRTVHSENEFKFLPISNSTQIWRRQNTAPPSFTTNWSDNLIASKIEDLPFVLDESEHSAIESLPYVKEQPNVNTVNGDSIKENGVIQASTFIITATDSRTKRSLQNNSITSMTEGHKKSASFDESVRLSLSSKTTDSTSVSNSFDEAGKIIELPKKEKKSALKRLFKSLNFK